VSRSVRVGLLIAAVKLCYVLQRLIAVLGVYPVVYHVVPFHLIASRHFVPGTAGRAHLFWAECWNYCKLRKWPRRWFCAKFKIEERNSSNTSDWAVKELEVVCRRLFRRKLSLYVQVGWVFDTWRWVLCSKRTGWLSFRYRAFGSSTTAGGCVYVWSSED